MSFQTTQEYPGLGVTATLDAQVPDSTLQPENSHILRSRESDSGI